MHGAVTVIVQEHRHPAHRILVRFVEFCCCIERHLPADAPGDNVLHVTYMGSRQAKYKAVHTLVVRFVAASYSKQHQLVQAASERLSRLSDLPYTNLTEDHAT